MVSELRNESELESRFDHAPCFILDFIRTSKLTGRGGARRSSRGEQVMDWKRSNHVSRFVTDSRVEMVEQLKNRRAARTRNKSRVDLPFLQQIATKEKQVKSDPL